MICTNKYFIYSKNFNIYEKSMLKDLRVHMYERRKEEVHLICII